jgi:hypothetical protein
VQYHPEAGPGPHDSRYLFAQFAALMDEGTSIWTQKRTWVMSPPTALPGEPTNALHPLAVLTGDVN